MTRIKDLTNQIFGCNKVLYRIKTPRGTNAWWRVKCVDCGREKDEMGTKLKYPTYQSCTCHANEIQGTPYEAIDHVALFTDSNNKNFIVDIEEAEKVSKYTWSVYTTTNGKEYVRCSYLNTTLHRFLLDPKDNEVVDHINGNTLDNCKNNLRVCTHTQNMQNQKLRSNNTTGVKGVTKCGRRYRATIRVNKKDIHIGMFDTLEKAKEERLKAEEKYFEEYRYKESDVNEAKAQD